MENLSEVRQQTSVGQMETALETTEVSDGLLNNCKTSGQKRGEIDAADTENQGPEFPKVMETAMDEDMENLPVDLEQHMQDRHIEEEEEEIGDLSVFDSVEADKQSQDYVEDSCDSDVFPNYDCSLKGLREVKPCSGHSAQNFSPERCTNENEGENSKTEKLSGESSGSLGFLCWICEKNFKRKSGLSTHMKMHLKVKRNYKKPKRMCPYCYTDQCDLTRHLLLCHMNIPEVEEAANLLKGTEERKLAFSKFRKEGIFKHNKNQASLESPQFLAERPVHGDIVACTSCKGCYSRSVFYRHKDRCIKDSTTPPSHSHIDALKDSTDQFTCEILSKFHLDEVGNICRADATIVLIGRRFFQKNLRKVDKTMEVKKSVMSDMRILGRLYLAFREISSVETLCSEDMFKRTNFETLEQAIDQVTKGDDGTKHQLNYLLRCSADFIVGSYLSKGEDAKAEEIKKFTKLLVLNRDFIFGDAAYAINLISRQESLRMPEQQAEEAAVQLLHQFITSTIKQLSSVFTFVGHHKFFLLRDSLCARLTLFNARRGGEPSRLKLAQLQDAFSCRWIDKKAIQKLEEWEQDLFKDLLVAYQPGNGNHLVPVLIPSDLVNPLKIITDIEVRERASVSPNNIYVFAMTELSNNHVHGWASINKMCKEANCVRPELLTASKQRHRISMMYCALDVPESEREYFYKHMGHTKQLNMGTYQYPLPVMKVTKVGRHLQKFDEFDTDTDSDLDSDSNHDSEQDDGSRSKNRTYFRWSDEYTQQIKVDFQKWIQMTEGNSLPSKKHLQCYLDQHQIGCSCTQLRTKIMNEQNKQQLFKTRCSDMNMKEF